MKSIDPQLLRFAEELADPNFSLSVPSPAKIVIRKLLDALEAAEGDEHHTMDELYEYRMLYNAHAAHGWDAAGIPVVKSWSHSDGEKCFGGGWFIVTATLPTGQVSNHYAAEHWDLFNVHAVNLPPEYDGHTPEIAAERLRESLAAATATTMVEIGGQTMTAAQFHAARYPLLHPTAREEN